ncbi:MAG TPA: PKD domain-containing protein [bacterium]|nr:PKD domain-containing protein [bacterium]
MRRLPLYVLLALAALASVATLGCHTNDDESLPIPTDPGANPNNPPVNPPDFGNPPPGQNDPLRVVANVLENDRKAPVTTALMADVEGGIPPYTINWFYDDDAVVDGTGQNVGVTFASAGDFQVRVEVRDSANVVATDTVEVHVLPPGPNLRIIANGQMGMVTGRAPLLVNFNTTQTTGAVIRWQWDWEGDGVFDMTSTITGNANHTYTTPGTYTPILRATDEEGNTEEASVLVVATF